LAWARKTTQEAHWTMLERQGYHGRGCAARAGLCSDRGSVICRVDSGSASQDTERCVCEFDDYFPVQYGARVPSGPGLRRDTGTRGAGEQLGSPAARRECRLDTRAFTFSTRSAAHRAICDSTARQQPPRWCMAARLASILMQTTMSAPVRGAGLLSRRRQAFSGRCAAPTRGFRCADSAVTPLHPPGIACALARPPGAAWSRNVAGDCRTSTIVCGLQAGIVGLPNVGKVNASVSPAQ
jgi:hypothetical protein